MNDYDHDYKAAIVPFLTGIEAMIELAERYDVDRNHPVRDQLPPDARDEFDAIDAALGAMGED